jgi:hypothetical protein
MNPSGWNLTEEPDSGYPAARGCASLLDVYWDHHRIDCCCRRRLKVGRWDEHSSKKNEPGGSKDSNLVYTGFARLPKWKSRLKGVVR